VRALLLVLALGCVREQRPCGEDGECVQENGGQGQCVEGFCAFSDPSCATGLRWDYWAERPDRCVPRPDASPPDAGEADAPEDAGELDGPEPDGPPPDA
jgi:hypothetical protein